MFAIIIYLILVPLMIFLMLKDKRLILDWLKGYLPKERGLAAKVWEEMDQQIGNYARGKFTEIVIVGGATYIVFVVMGLNYATLLGVLVGLSMGLECRFCLYHAGLRHCTGAGWQCAGAVIIFRGREPASGCHHPGSNCVRGDVGTLGCVFAIPLATLVKAVLYAWPSAHAQGKEAGEELGVGEGASERGC